MFSETFTKFFKTILLNWTLMVLMTTYNTVYEKNIELQQECFGTIQKNFMPACYQTEFVSLMKTPLLRAIHWRIIEEFVMDTDSYRSRLLSILLKHWLLRSDLLSTELKPTLLLLKNLNFLPSHALAFDVWEAYFFQTNNWLGITFW